ncbi:MAG: YraN family protein [Gemmatimonadetes bacterium]|nr:MAG: YraN family protein [Gemmatimonadota bacterium]
MRSAECGMSTRASLGDRPFIATPHSAFRIPHSALLGHRRHSFGYAARPPGSYYCSVKSGLRTDPSQWTDERHRRGIAGEEQAIRYLLSRGCTIVAHRFRVGHTEIDLIARQGDLVTFVEVKTRRGKAFGSPLEAVTGAKRRELVKAARVWVDRFGKPADIYRFDCIAIVDSKLEHLADAFRPGWR